MRISDWSSDVCSSDLFEADRNAAALACYHDDARSLETVVRAFFSEAGVGISREAVAFLASQLGGDRELTRRELEKVLLFAGDGEVALADRSETRSVGKEGGRTCRSRWWPSH